MFGKCKVLVNKIILMITSCQLHDKLRIVASISSVQIADCRFLRSHFAHSTYGMGVYLNNIKASTIFSR